MLRSLILTAILAITLPSYSILALDVAAIESASEVGDRLDRFYSATCRVRVGGGTGTGTIFNAGKEAYPQGYYYVLTNSHVVKVGQQVTCEFTSPASSRAGHYRSPRIAGECIASRLVQGGGFDAAIVRIPKSKFPFEMPFIPLAEADQATPKAQLLTCGCQAGEWPSLQEVTINKNQADDLIYFRPTARPGRSGSALVDIKASRIVGLVAWMTSEDSTSQGLAMSAHKIREWISSYTDKDVSTDISTVVVGQILPNSAVPIPLAPAPFESDVAYSDENPWLGPGDRLVAPGAPAPRSEFGGVSPWGNLDPGDDDYSHSTPEKPLPPEPKVPDVDHLKELGDSISDQLDKLSKDLTLAEQKINKNTESVVGAAVDRIISYEPEPEPDSGYGFSTTPAIILVVASLAVILVTGYSALVWLFKKSETPVFIPQAVSPTAGESVKNKLRF